MKPASTCLLLLLMGLAAVRADVKVPSIFSDHMVLMKSNATPIWGKADPNEQVTVTLNGKTAQAAAGADHKWKVTLDLAEMDAGPYQLTIAGRNKITISDVVVGQTWLVIGQSNPERVLKESANASEEIARSADPLLRQFRIERKGNDVPQDDANGTWVPASPETSADFTAIGYYFGKKLRGEVKQPVGIINGSWGGTIIEAWASAEAIAKDPDLQAAEEGRRKEMADFKPKKEAYVKDMGDWLKANDREDKPCPDPATYAAPGISTADWTPLKLPGKIAGPNLPSNGAIWVRREIDVPASVQNIVIKAALGRMTCFEDTYWNGKKIFEMPYQKLPGEGYAHYFPIPQSEIHPGKTTFAIRLYAPIQPPEIMAPPGRFWIGPIPLEGEWLAKAEYSLPPLDPQVAAAAPTLPHEPPGIKASSIFNGVVHPIIPYGLAGIVWYQGESNTGIAYDYRTIFPLFIADLREKWNQPDLPFYFCQLANFQPKLPAPDDSPWAELRESQSLALKLPNTAQAVLIDIGESDDIHARNKADVGDRLARIALARQYGQSGLIYSGPVYDTMAVEGSKIRVKFTHTEGGLAAKPLPKTYDVKTIMNQTAPLVPNSPGSEVEGFAICGDDHRWVWADAKIDGDSVVVSSEKVPAPVAVRYAWADNPTCNLTNGSGLPASPFRTDDFPATTAKYHFGTGPGRF